MKISPSGYALIGLTAIIACLVAVLTFALLRLMAAVRDTNQRARPYSAEAALLSAVLQEAVAKLKMQERDGRACRSLRASDLRARSSQALPPAPSSPA